LTTELSSPPTYWIGLAQPQFDGHFGEPLAEPRGEHFAVPVDAQLGGQPLQLGADGIGDGAVQHLAVRLEGAAQPPGGDPHAVHGVVGVQAYGGVEGDDRGDLVAYVVQDDVTGGGLGRGLLP
jgi:hypothetical protein